MGRLIISLEMYLKTLLFCSFILKRPKFGRFDSFCSNISQAPSSYLCWQKKASVWTVLRSSAAFSSVLILYARILRTDYLQLSWCDKYTGIRFITILSFWNLKSLQKGSLARRVASLPFSEHQGHTFEMFSVGHLGLISSLDM